MEEYEKLMKKDRILREAAKILRVDPRDLPRVIERFKKEIKSMEAKLK